MMRTLVRTDRVRPTGWFSLIPPFGTHALAGHVWVPIDERTQVPPRR